MIYHIGFFKIKAEIEETQINAAFVALSTVHGATEGAGEFAYGRDCSVEGLSKGHTHGFVMSFANLEARDEYLHSKAHQRWLEDYFLPLVEGEPGEFATTFDFLDNHQK